MVERRRYVRFSPDRKLAAQIFAEMRVFEPYLQELGIIKVMLCEDKIGNAHSRRLRLLPGKTKLSHLRKRSRHYQKSLVWGVSDGRYCIPDRLIDVKATTTLALDEKD